MLTHLDFRRQLNVLLVYKDVSIPRLAGSQVNDGLVGLRQWPRLDPWLDILLNSQGQHVSYISGRTDGAAANLDAIGDEMEGIDLREFATVRRTGREGISKMVSEGGGEGRKHTRPG